jgi:hypothetical protein
MADLNLFYSLTIKIKPNAALYNIFPIFMQPKSEYYEKNNYSIFIYFNLFDNLIFTSKY